MQQEPLLLGIAQIAVTLAGFSGLVVALRGTPSSAWHPRDIWSLAWMFGSSLGALFLSLLPLLLTACRLPDQLVWKLPSFVMCIFLLVFVFAMKISSRHLARAGHAPRVRYFPVAATLLLTTCAVLSALSGFEIFAQQRVGIFLASLLACLLVSALSLVVFLVVLARTARTR